MNHRDENTILFDCNPIYFREIAALGKGRSREWECKVGKRINDSREMILRALDDFCSLLKVMGKKDQRAQSLHDALKKSVRKWGVVKTGELIVVKKIILETKATLSQKWDSAESDFFAKTEKQFCNGHTEFKKACTELVEKNLRLVPYTIQKFFRNRIGLTFSDAIQEGNLGLMNAAELYCYTRGHFNTYALGWIRQLISRAYMNKSRDIRVPVGTQELMRKIARVEMGLYQRLEGKPKPEDIAAALGISPKIVFECSGMLDPLYSIDSEIPNKKNIFLKNIISDNTQQQPNKVYEKAETDRIIQQTMQQELTERERFIIFKRFGLDGEPPQTLREISYSLNLTRERVRQIETHAIEKLRSSEITKKLMVAV